jgi:hypothetical protein
VAAKIPVSGGVSKKMDATFWKSKIQTHFQGHIQSAMQETATFLGILPQMNSMTDK